MMHPKCASLLFTGIYVFLSVIWKRSKLNFVAVSKQEFIFQTFKTSAVKFFQRFVKLSHYISRKLMDEIKQPADVAFC